MIKRIYHISGFNCPHCAARTESFLAKQDNIEYCHLDFANNKLFITYKKEELSIEELLKLIKVVEANKIDLSLIKNNSDKNNKNKIITKSMVYTFYRVIFAVLVTVICLFFLAKDEPLFNWLRISLYGIATTILLYDIFWRVILHIKHKENILDHNLLITISSIGAFSLGLIDFLINGKNPIHHFGEFAIAHDGAMEALMVVTLFQIGQIIENIATNKSKAAIMSAVELRVDKANKITEKGIETVEPESLMVGDKIIIRHGEMIPIDGEIYEGEALIDTSSLTGEYVPILAKSGNKVYGGCLIKEGTVSVVVSKKYNDSTIAKISDLIASGGEKKSKADQFIAKFSKWYTPTVVIVAFLVFLIGGLITQNEWLKYVSVGLKIIVTGCPCAIVISVPLAYFSAIGLASKNGIVVKGANYLDSFVNLGKVITDKTGTLTKGQFEIIKISASNNENELLESLWIAECLSTHPIGRAICQNADVDKYTKGQKDFVEYAGLGVKTTYEEHAFVAGSYKFIKQEGFDIVDVEENGVVTHCVKDGKYLGYVVLSDVIKEEAKTFVKLLQKANIEIVLLTGDKENNARLVCQNIGINKFYSNLLPEDKTKILDEEMQGYDKNVAYIGDGINDAPSIIRSDIGIAMGGIGSDIAVENADVVIMNDDPMKVYDTIRISKMARNTAIFNIVFALFVKISVAILVTIFKDKIGMTVAVLADTGLTVLLVINSLLLLYRRIHKRKSHLRD